VGFRMVDQFDLQRAKLVQVQEIVDTTRKSRSFEQFHGRPRNRVCGTPEAQGRKEGCGGITKVRGGSAVVLRSCTEARLRPRPRGLQHPGGAALRWWMGSDDH
jgi:hypothetical protein